jgi:nicotinamide phosphoribosyltransferase
MEIAGFSADNVAFGQGGALLQSINRDTMQWAMKCSAVGVREGEFLEWRDVYKDPVTDSGKRSKRGRVTLWESGGEYQSSVTQPMGWTDKGMKWNHVLEEVYRDGVLVKEITFDEVRANARK